MSQGCQEKNSRKMHFFRKQEPTNFAYFSAKNEKRYLTTVCVIIIMKKLHRGVAQMVARMVRDHEAASSSLATPTIIGPNIDTMCRCLVRFFFALKVACCKAFCCEWVHLYKRPSKSSSFQKVFSRNKHAGRKSKRFKRPQSFQ